MHFWQICAGISTSLYLTAAVLIAITGLHDHIAVADIIVVPGNTVHADGTLSARLQGRLDAALAIFKARQARIIFLSGGVGKEGRDEARAMADYLVARGVSPAAIVCDSLGSNTAATAAHAGQYLRAHQMHSALVVTQYFHVARTSLALERNGVTVVGTAHARYFELRDIYSLAREVPGFALYYLTL